MKTASIGNESIVSAAPGQLSSKLGDEMVILHLESGVYYGLDTVGARVWELAQQSKSVRQIRDQIVSEFDVAPETCEQDIRELLAQMQAQGLVLVASAENA
ncbi:MAG TPA: PqqD family peptide modification chaperone [Tepidisphaeraceae bacterium]|nr:PqqD family peptide modification chaperone [Tepidisphaeraceae bacterium]